MIFKPIFKSEYGDINLLKYVNGSGTLFVATENGGIVSIKDIPNNYAGYGLNNVFAQSVNGDGDITELLSNSVFYDLYDIISKVNINKEIEIIKEEVNAFGINTSKKVYGVYVSETLMAEEDFGFWKEISLNQISNGGRIIIALKVDEDKDRLKEKDWEYYFGFDNQYGYSNGENYIKSLDRFNLKGRFLQFKVTLEIDDINHNPYVNEIIISYHTKKSVFFFTRKLKFDKKDNINDIIITSTYYEPRNTEILFGVTNDNSTDWSDYTILEKDRIKKLSDVWGHDIKIGIKMSSLGVGEVPVVDEFGVLFNTNKNKLINKEE